MSMPGGVGSSNAAAQTGLVGEKHAAPLESGATPALTDDTLSSTQILTAEQALGLAKNALGAMTREVSDAIQVAGNLTQNARDLVQQQFRGITDAEAQVPELNEQVLAERTADTGASDGGVTGTEGGNPLPSLQADPTVTPKTAQELVKDLKNQFMNLPITGINETNKKEAARKIETFEKAIDEFEKTAQESDEPLKIQNVGKNKSEILNSCKAQLKSAKDALIEYEKKEANPAIFTQAHAEAQAKGAQQRKANASPEQSQPPTSTGKEDPSPLDPNKTFESWMKQDNKSDADTVVAGENESVDTAESKESQVSIATTNFTTSLKSVKSHSSHFKLETTKFSEITPEKTDLIQSEHKELLNAGKEIQTMSQSAEQLFQLNPSEGKTALESAREESQKLLDMLIAQEDAGHNEGITGGFQHGDYGQGPIGGKNTAHIAYLKANIAGIDKLLGKAATAAPPAPPTPQVVVPPVPIKPPTLVSAPGLQTVETPAAEEVKIDVVEEPAKETKFQTREDFDDMFGQAVDFKPNDGSLKFDNALDEYIHDLKKALAADPKLDNFDELEANEAELKAFLLANNEELYNKNWPS